MLCSQYKVISCFNTKSTGAQGILKPKSVILMDGMIKNPNPPDSRGNTDWGFNIPQASVLLVINTLILPNSSCICLNTPSLYTSWQGY